MKLNKKNMKIIYEVLFGLHKSIYINFRYLPFKQAIKLPILVSKYCSLLECSGKMSINSRVTTGMILLGIGNVGIFDKKSCRSVIELSESSIVEFNGKARLGNGTKISSSGRIEFGNNFTITSSSSIICNNEVKFRDDVLISWECLIMDSDLHTIYRNGKKSNLSDKIEIGNNVWIGCRCTLLKGSIINDNSIIASNSLVNRYINEKNVLIGGQPAKIIDRNIKWTR